MEEIELKKNGGGWGHWVISKRKENRGREGRG